MTRVSEFVNLNCFNFIAQDSYYLKNLFYFYQLLYVLIQIKIAIILFWVAYGIIFSKTSVSNLHLHIIFDQY